MTADDHPVIVGSVLFTDLVGFTEYTGAVGDTEALRVLDDQRALLDGQLEARDDARLVKEIGDGLMIWIGSAIEGLSVATHLLETLVGVHSAGTFPLAVRMGMHHGESIARGDDLVGQTVNIAARISALAGPGELLVSDDLLAACGPDPADRHLRPIGPVRVKGVREPIWLHRFATS
jgi:adenylate cyclase